MFSMVSCTFLIGIAIYLLYVGYFSEKRYEVEKKRYDDLNLYDKFLEDLFMLSLKIHLYNMKFGIRWFNLKQLAFLNYDNQKNIIKKEFYTRSAVQAKVEKIVEEVIEEIEKSGEEEKSELIRRLLRLIEAEVIERDRYMTNLSEEFNKNLVIGTLVVTIGACLITMLASPVNIGLSWNLAIMGFLFILLIFSFLLFRILREIKRINSYMQKRETYLYVLSFAKNYIKDEIS